MGRVRGQQTAMAESTITVSERLVAAVCAARKRRGWTREDLAHYSGVSWSAITQIEARRRTDVRISTLVAIADALDMSIDYLMGRQPGPALRHCAGLFNNDDELAAGTRAFVNNDAATEKALLVLANGNSRSIIKRVVADDHLDYSEVTNWDDEPTGVHRRLLDFARKAQRSAIPWAGVIVQIHWENYSRAQIEAWRRYDALLNLTFAAHPVDILCLYDGRNVTKPVMETAGRTHPEVFEGGAVRPSASYVEPEEFVTFGAAG